VNILCINDEAYTKTYNDGILKREGGAAIGFHVLLH